ncbi:SDR family oxidoreductase [Glaciimonas soli]|uniref:SDR family oxidoreductase n=1 Tax=Glaciimonas soli TaxID=2590999 RepID=A0A843YLA2_9BURK|nr:SDR family oxidoreductase [Glaciimonas soli]MQQ99709.1 SDR family oxidoreductase [Glaciimonas soli]
MQTIKAVVTGHTKGLGAAIAENLLAKNIPVLGLSRASNAALAARFPDTFQQVSLDLTNTVALNVWLSSDILQRFFTDSQSVLLVNNAGMLQPVGPIETHDFSTIAAAINLNVAAPMMLASAVLAASQNVKDRRVMHISSGAGRSATAGWGIYGATKAALDHYARIAATDLSPGVRIASVAPGIVDTDMQSEIRSSSVEKFPSLEKFQAFKRDGALSSPDECARRLTAYLLSDQFGETAVADIRQIVV